MTDYVNDHETIESGKTIIYRLSSPRLSQSSVKVKFYKKYI